MEQLFTNDKWEIVIGKSKRRGVSLHVRPTDIGPEGPDAYFTDTVTSVHVSNAPDQDVLQACDEIIKRRNRKGGSAPITVEDIIEVVVAAGWERAAIAAVVAELCA